MERESEVGSGSGEVSGVGGAPDTPDLPSEPSEPSEPEDPPEGRYGTVCVEDSPELFPFLVEQFFQLKSKFPSICCGSIYDDVDTFCRTFGERLLVMVDWSDLSVVAGISFSLFPKTSSLYVGYMITEHRLRGRGFMKILFQEMKDYAEKLYPWAYNKGFCSIVAETLVHPLPEYKDYFSTWENIHNTHSALNKIGFYQCAFNYVMYGEVEDDGLITKGSTDYIMMVHKDSTNISKSKHPNFSLEIDSWFLESVMYNFVRMDLKTWTPANLGEEFLASLSSIPADKCSIRQLLPFYRTDKLYPDHLK